MGLALALLAALLASFCTVVLVRAKDRRLARRDRFRRSHGQWNRHGGLSIQVVVGILLGIQVALLGFRVAGVIAWPMWCVMLPTELVVVAVLIVAAMGLYLWWAFRSLI
jgi:hypothetical protein